MPKRDLREHEISSRNSPMPFSGGPRVLPSDTHELMVDHTPTPAITTALDACDRNRFLTVHEVADLLQVPVSWVYGRMRARSTDKLPAYRIGKYWRFREEEIVTWMQRHRRGSDAA